MRPILIPAAALALLTFCTPDRNRQDSETGMGGAAAGGLSSNDTAPAGNATPTPAAILSELSGANTAEIRLASVAAKQAASPQVKQIAKKLAADHSRNLEQLRALAQKLDVNLTGNQPGAAVAADSTALPADLEDKSGPGFDQTFVRHEIEEHQASIDKIKIQMIPAAQHEQIKAYLQETVTEMEGHLTALKRVEHQLGA
jgi:putative membrane protein